MIGRQKEDKIGIDRFVGKKNKVFVFAQKCTQILDLIVM